MKEQNSLLQTKVDDYNYSTVPLNKKLNKYENRNVSLTQFVKETTRNQIHLKNGQSVTVYDVIINKLSPEEKMRIIKSMDLEESKKTVEIGEKSG